MAVDYAGRLRFLISQEGSQRAFFRSEQARRGGGLKRATIYRILRGGRPSARNRELINRRFRQKAPPEVRDRERRGQGAGFALVDEAKAKEIERSYQREGLEYSVVAHLVYSRQIRGVGRPVEGREIGRGRTVDEAKANLESNFDRFRLAYPQWRIEAVGVVRYRVYLTGVDFADMARRS